MIDFEQIQHTPEAPLEEVVKKQTDIVSPEIYTTYISKKSIYVTNQLHQQQVLYINRNNGENDFVDLSQFQDAQKDENFDHKEKFFALFGQVTVQNVKFLIFVHKARIAARLFDIPIYEVLSVQFLTTSNKKYEDKFFEKCWENLSRIKNYIKSGFYFSYYYPLHASFKGDLSFCQKNQISLRKNVFVWNYNALCSFNAYLADSEFFLPFIQGFVGSIDMDQVKMILISRRSYMMGGTRYNSRGIDNQGNVANFVETEQILVTENKVCSFVQYRGSMPFFWGQKGIKAKIQVSEKHQENFIAFLKHLDQLKENYYLDKITFFNLLGEHRNNENLLTEEFEKLLGEKQKNNKVLIDVDYMYCDFHAITKEIDHTAVNDYIKNLLEKNPGFNLYDRLDDQKFQKIQDQKDAIRSNCLDCLDRTNAVQTKISFLQLYDFVQKEQYDIFKDEYFQKDPLEYLQKSNNNFVNQFRVLWADNGDNISIVYAGTGATTSSVTRKGQKSGLSSMLDHGFKTISRFYLNNFEDQYKQEIIEQILNLKKSNQRQSLLNLDMMNVQRFQVATICLFSVKNNPLLEFDVNFIEQIFEKTQQCDFVLFIFYNDEKKIIKIKQNQFKQYSHIKDIFKDYETYQKNFEVCKTVNNKKYQMILFKKNQQNIQCQNFIEQKIKSIFWQESQGHLISFTLNSYPIQIFIIKSSSKNHDQNSIVQKIVKDYKDQKARIFFIFANTYNEMKLEDIDDNLTMIYSNSIEFEDINQLQNQSILLCLRQMIDKGIQPMEANLDLDFENLQKGYALNSRIFVLFKQKNMQQIIKIKKQKLLYIT